jgi:hypothetical protein
VPTLRERSGPIDAYPVMNPFPPRAAIRIPPYKPQEVVTLAARLSVGALAVTTSVPVCGSKLNEPGPRSWIARAAER